MMDIKMLANALRVVYPNFQEADLIVPKKIVDAMIILQEQQSQFTVEYIGYITAMDRAKYELEKHTREMDSTVARETIEGLMSASIIPQAFRKNKELTENFVKYSSSVYSEMRQHNEELLRNAAKTKSDAKKCELLLSSIKIAIEAATQILSYLKFEQKLDTYGS